MTILVFCRNSDNERDLILLNSTVNRVASWVWASVCICGVAVKLLAALLLRETLDVFYSQWKLEAKTGL